MNQLKKITIITLTLLLIGTGIVLNGGGDDPDPIGQITTIMNS